MTKVLEVLSCPNDSLEHHFDLKKGLELLNSSQQIMTVPHEHI